MGAFLSPFRPVSVMTSVSLFLPPFFAGKVLISTINVLSLHSENDGRTQCMSALWKTPWLLTQSSAGSTVGRACKLIKSVQFKTCTWKSRCALHPISLWSFSSIVFETQFQHSSDWWQPFQSFQRRLALPLSMPLSSRRLMVRCPWLCALR